MLIICYQIKLDKLSIYETYLHYRQDVLLALHKVLDQILLTFVFSSVALSLAAQQERVDEEVEVLRHWA
jgi:hypothetical protein